MHKYNRERDTGCHTCEMCNDAELHKMELTLSAEKKLLTFVPIQSGDISVHRLFHILLQLSAVTSSSGKRRRNRDALSRIVELSRLPRETPSLDRYSMHFSISWQQL